MRSITEIEKDVVRMYQQIPFPDYGAQPLEERWLASIKSRDNWLGYDGAGCDVYKDRDVLEAGCGTGRESMYIASRGARLTAVDITDRSLAAAGAESRRHTFRHPIRFLRASVLDLPFDSGTFDVVVSSGVIHHTPDPEKAFSELARVLRPGGYVVLFVYNNWAHVIPNLRRGLVNLFAGNDPHRRVAYAKRFFRHYLRNRNLAAIYDEFGHPHKSEHSIKEVLTWFDRYGVEYRAVHPGFGWRGDYAAKQARNEYMKTGTWSPPDEGLLRPTLRNRVGSATRLLYKGYRAYSHGFRYMGVKRAADGNG